MGAFFSNIQVQVSPDNLNGDKERIIEQIRQIHAGQGYTQVDTENKADKSVIISTQKGSSWIAVYDEENENFKDETLNSLASTLSGRLKTNVLGVSVGDSDYIYIALAKNGAVVDTISNLNEKYEVDFSKCQPVEWENLISEKPFSFTEIQEAWHSRDIFVEGFLDIFVKLLGVPQQNILTGYNYLHEEESASEIRLHFAKAPAQVDEALMPVSLNLLVKNIDSDFMENETQKLKWIITNYGEASQGMDIMINGEAIENGYLKPLSAKIYFFHDATQFREFPFTETKDQTGRILFDMPIVDFPIQKGEKPYPGMTNKKFNQLYSNLYAIAFAIEIEFSALKKGESKFNLFIVPRENRGVGTYSETVKVVIN